MQEFYDRYGPPVRYRSFRNIQNNLPTAKKEDQSPRKLPAAPGGEQNTRKSNHPGETHRSQKLNMEQRQGNKPPNYVLSEDAERYFQVFLCAFSDERA